MSSYFQEVILGDDHMLDRASKVVELGTYLGVAPEFITVLYKPGDKLGQISAIASLIPIFICVALFTAFLCRRTADDLWIGGGQVASEILNAIIKLYIREPRPSSPVSNIPADSYGMPSAHAQYMGYFAMIMTIHTINAPALSFGYRLFRIISVSLVSMFTAYSRYYLYYHSGRQVIVGYLVGSVLGVVWLILGEFIRKVGLLRWGLTLWPCRVMMVKDVRYSVYQEYQEYTKSLEKKSR